MNDSLNSTILMDFFHIFSILIVLSAVFAYVNYRVLKLPSSIGLMLISLLFSVCIFISSFFFPSFRSIVTAHLDSINFSELLLEVMLSFMLFAGAIHLKFEDLKKEWPTVILLATIGVLISTLLIGYATFFVLNALGIEVELIHALLFGALISPTDPISVLSILKTSGISKSLETKIAGESLFNDGVAVVIFITLFQLSKPGNDFTLLDISMLFMQEAIGGILLGLAFGYIGYKMMASIDDYRVEVLITLAIVMGGYTMAHFIHVSGPLAMVAAGLITGNHSKDSAMSALTAEYIETFWELVDEIFNALLFVLIGFELLVVKTNKIILISSILFIVISLAARYISVFLPSLLIRYKGKMSQGTLVLLTWGGLRGGISIALALSIPSAFHRDIWVTLTYIIVCFSIVVQGLTIGKLSKKVSKENL